MEKHGINGVAHLGINASLVTSQRVETKNELLFDGCIEHRDLGIRNAFHFTEKRVINKNSLRFDLLGLLLANASLEEISGQGHFYSLTRQTEMFDGWAFP